MELQIFTGRSNIPFAQAVCAELGTELGKIEWEDFADGEVSLKYPDNIRGQDVYLIQSTNQPDRNLIELLLMIDAAWRASAGRITAVIPYMGYARQDRKSESRTPISIDMWGEILSLKADHFINMDLHAQQSIPCFRKRFDHLYARPVFVEYFKKHYDLENLVVVAPDAGAGEVASAFAVRLCGDNNRVAVLQKRRDKKNKSSVVNVIGEVKSKNALIIDDIIDTAGTLINGAEALLAKGASSVRAFCVHGVLSGDIKEKLCSDDKNALPFERLFLTDTIYQEDWSEYKKAEIISVAPLFAEAIKRRHEGRSISCLFE